MNSLWFWLHKEIVFLLLSFNDIRGGFDSDWPNTIVCSGITERALNSLIVLRCVLLKISVNCYVFGVPCLCAELYHYFIQFYQTRYLKNISMSMQCQYCISQPAHTAIMIISSAIKHFTISILTLRVSNRDVVVSMLDRSTSRLGIDPAASKITYTVSLTSQGDSKLASGIISAIFPFGTGDTCQRIHMQTRHEYMQRATNPFFTFSKLRRIYIA